MVLQKVNANCVARCPNDLLNKVHIPATSNCSFLFTCSKVGKSIWHSTCSDDFTFYDPYMHETPIEYNPLHDPYLRTFFKRKVHHNHLRKNNFITDKNEVVCTLKDFNDYRRYLHRVKVERRADVMKKEHVEQLEHNRFRISNLVFNKIWEKNRKVRERYLKKEVNDEHKRCIPYNPGSYETMVQIMRQRKLEAECSRNEKLKEDQKKYCEHIARIEQQKIMKSNKIKERGLYKKLEIVKKQIFVTQNNRSRQIKIKKEIHARDRKMQNKIATKKRCHQPKKLLIVRFPAKI